MKEIHLIRHAESEANAAIDVDNPTNYFDAKITEKGKLQAQKKYEEYKSLNFDAYFCSSGHFVASKTMALQSRAAAHPKTVQDCGVGLDESAN